ncbi:helix-turn-helix domain-containing protein [Chitinophaga nivalis]|uniref:AraC family transcriptional regulator n=1 Tax=Chitinophaga nivalis TaxID=2991709 RepID=A0ABT3IR64_9BACT|nr:helix-turn-helix domain-containing protein [Chitinophaga nivalis]MCW3463867.1 AraC family transcriptional regulator [Chitinophaga nivalis]MCW3486443.1 AraC family transcriptional regulator [Chitinophaga nivalis]
MNFHIYCPEDALHPFVKQYYYWEDNTQGLIQLPQNLLALGDQYIVCILEGEATIKPAHHPAFTLPQNAIIGHFTCACQLQVRGPIKMAVIQLNAYGCYRVLGLDAAHFTNYYRNLDVLDLPHWQELPATLATLSTPEAMIPHLNNACKAAMAQQTRGLQQIDEIADYLLCNQGNVSLPELSHHFHLSRPTLERRFTAVVGLPPQLYARMIRYKTALRTLQDLRLPQWQAAITPTQYYNQAMFIKDYLLFHGETPAYFAPAAAAATIAHMPANTRVAVAS